MNQTQAAFAPEPPLIDGVAPQQCRACVVMPAKDEEAVLARSLDALSRQVDGEGHALAHGSYEILLLLNNCRDGSAMIAREWALAHPQMRLHICEVELPEPVAHVGTARRLLMDTAWHRLSGTGSEIRGILSTDADTVVADDWIYQSLAALQRGADVVGGEIHLLPDEHDRLPPHIQGCRRRDRQYAALIAQLEDRCDPQDHDRWPRHLDHFGASLACTPAAYALAGGLPPERVLEDEAFIGRVRCAGLQLRHEPRVRVFTSARVDGRVSVGLSWQLKQWQGTRTEGDHEVASAAYVAHRFRMLRKLRTAFEQKDPGDLVLPTPWWRDTFRDALATQPTCAAFLAAIFCDIFIDESFEGERREPVSAALEGLRARIQASTEASAGGSAASAPEAVPAASSGACQKVDAPWEKAPRPTSASVPSGLG